MGGDDGDNNIPGGSKQPNGEEPSTANVVPTKDGEDAGVAATASSTTDKHATARGEATSDVSHTRAEIVKILSFGEPAAADATASLGHGVDSVEAMGPQNSGDTVVIAAAVAAKGQVDDEKECDDHDQGDGVCGNDEDDDDLSSGAEEGKDTNGWADVEDGERTGYSGAEVEPFAVQEGIDGSCMMEVCWAD